jgi:hypothetical protein
MKGMFSKDNKAVAKRDQGGALVTTDLAKLGQMARDEVSKEDLPRPSLRILQKGSPQVDKKNAKYVEGAEAGMIYNTSTRALLDGTEESEKLVILICKYWPKYIEWLPGRKGFVGEHELGSEMSLPENITIKMEDGGKRRIEYSRLTNNVMVKTAIYYCLAFMDGSEAPEEVVIDMSSTNWSTAKLLNSHFDNAKIKDGNGNLVKAPIFTWAYQLYHEYKERSEENQSWYTWNFKPLVRIDEMIGKYQKYIQDYIKNAMQYREAVEKGSLKYDYQEQQPDM